MQFIPAVQPLAPATDQSWCLAFHEGQVLLPTPHAVELLPLHEPGRAALAEGATAQLYLGRLGGLDCWTMRLDAVPSGWHAQPLRATMMALPEPLMLLAGRAAQVLEWDRAHRFCGVCGTPTETHPSDRARRCPSCGYTAYPRISPAMMALVWRGRELLLARSPGYKPGTYSALAGFVEAGESIEECVVREVAEEVGVRVRNLSYYGSQSWPFPHSLMVAYRAEWDGGEIVPQPGEIEDAQWFDIDALPAIPPRFSISGHLILDTVEWLRSGACATR